MAETVSSRRDLEGLKTDIDAQEPPVDRVIPVDLMSGLSKLLKVVNAENESAVRFVMRDSEVEITLQKPVFVTEILLELASLENVRGIKLVAADILTGKSEKVSISLEGESGNAIRFILNKVITSFILKRGSYLSKNIKNIVVQGMFLDELGKFEREYRNLSEFKNELLEIIKKKQGEFSIRELSLVSQRQNLQKTKEETEKEVELLQEQTESLTKKFEDLRLSLANVTKEIEHKNAERAGLVIRNDELEKRNLSTESELSQKLQTLSSTNIAISDKEKKLKDLVNNVNVFSEEFSGFVAQGTTQVKMYAAFTLVPFTLLSVVVFYLFNGAVDLSTRFQTMAKIDVVTLLVTRLPFVAVAALIVGVSVKILYFLINRIIAIHQQRLDLAKIAIIAKDVSDATSADLGMSIEVQYEAKTYLKMSILRAYLSGQFEKFSYNKRISEPLSTSEKSSANDNSQIPVEVEA